MKYNLKFEKFKPYIFATFVFLLGIYLRFELPEKKDFLGGTLTISAILAGFLATAKSLLVAIDNDVMARIKKTSYHELLINYLVCAIYSCFLFSIYNLWGYFICHRNYLYSHCWLWLAVFCIFAFLRVMKIFTLIIKSE